MQYRVTLTFGKGSSFSSWIPSSFKSLKTTFGPILPSAVGDELGLVDTDGDTEAVIVGLLETDGESLGEFVGAEEIDGESEGD